MKNTPAVILAAGESSRFWPLNSRHKALFRIMGRPILWYTLEGLRKAGIKNISIVQGIKKDVEQELKNYQWKGMRITYVVQKEPKGMGNALWQARNLFQSPFFVLNAERVDIKEIIQNSKIKIQNNKSKSKIILFCQKTNNPQLFGVAKLRGDKVLDIIEKPQKGKEPSHMKLVGVYLLRPDFFKFYAKTKKGMYDFENALSLYAKENEVRAVIIKKKEEDTPFLKYPWHLFGMAKYLFDNYLVPSAADSVIFSKNVTVDGKVYIGNNVRVFENAVLRGPCYIGDNTVIGNNALVREYSDIEEGCIVGANAEICRSLFQKNVHCHSGFFGDSVIGETCRIGAGTITANVRFDRMPIHMLIQNEYINTGLNSLGVFLGKGTHIGVHTSLMPGILIGKDSIVGPNSFVKENIADGMLFYSEHHKIHKKYKRR